MKDYRTSIGPSPELAAILERKAVVIAKVYRDGRPLEQAVATIKTEMSTDLPADNLGELVADAIQEAWKAGHDPMHFSVVISFS